MAELHLVQEYGFLGGVGGSCALCGASKRTLDRPERIVTTNLVTDMQDAPPGVWPEKYLEFCEQCINEMGRLVGMISENEADILAQKLIASQAEVTALQGKVVALTDALHATEVLAKHLTNNPPVPVTAPTPSSPPATPPSPKK